MIAVPAIVSTALQAVLAIPGARTGLKWLGIGAAGVAVLGAAYGIGYLNGRLDGRASCKLTALQSRLEAANHDLQTQKAVAAQASAARNLLETTRETLQEKVNAYETELSKRRDRACLLNDADVRGLRNITKRPAPASSP